MHNKDTSRFDGQCSGAFNLKRNARFWWTEPLTWDQRLAGKSLSAVKWDLNLLKVKYSKAKRHFSVRNGDVLKNSQIPHKLWSTHKSAVFGSSSSLPPLVGGYGRQVCESVGKANQLSDHFDSKQSRVSVDLLFTCYPSPSLTTFALGQVRLCVSCYILGRLWWHWPIGYVSSFSEETAGVLGVVFQQLFIWVVSLLARGKLMSPQFWKVCIFPISG